MTTLTSLIRRIDSRSGIRRRGLIELAAAGKLGQEAFWQLHDDRDAEDLQAVPGWPECECVGCWQRIEEE